LISGAEFGQVWDAAQVARNLHFGIPESLRTVCSSGNPISFDSIIRADLMAIQKQGLIFLIGVS
jgi:hypothetical protein